MMLLQQIKLFLKRFVATCVRNTQTLAKRQKLPPKAENSSDDEEESVLFPKEKSKSKRQKK
jgi:hypothetical protein